MSPRQAAQWCLDAYTAPPQWHDGQNVAVAIGRDLNGVTAIAFRGTQPRNLHDDLADLDIGPKAVSGFGLVHDGFWQAGSAMARPIGEAVDGRPWHVMGHSLGGAIALVVATRLAESGHAPLSLTTFGAPRVFLGNAAAAVAGRLLAPTAIAMYRHGADPVPHLPPRMGAVLDWAHPVDLIQLGPQGVIPSIGDHAMDWYLQALGDHL